MKLSEIQHAMECECCSHEIDIMHDVLAASDEAVAKALMISDVARIARAEVRMRDLLLKKWRNRVDQAATRAGAIFAGGGSLEKAYAAVDAAMGRWNEDVASRYGQDIQEIYGHARNAGWKKANGQTSASLQYTVPNFTEEIEAGRSVVKVEKARRKKRRNAAVKPTFDLYDEQAVLQLQDDQMLWIGIHYNKNVRATVRESVKPGLIKGIGRVEAGKRVAEAVAKDLRKVTVPGGFNGSDAKYFEGLAANTATNSRVRGQVRSFSDLGVTRYEIVNPMDGRTSRICAFMNGRVFTVNEGVAQIETVSGATTPEQVKKGHPWVTQPKAQKIHKSGGDRGLAKGGLSLPPYHFRCRSTVDISTESVSFGALTAVEQPPIPVRVEPTRRNTPKRRKPTSKPSRSTPAKRPATIPRNVKTLKAA